MKIVTYIESAYGWITSLSPTSITLYGVMIAIFAGLWQILVNKSLFEIVRSTYLAVKRRMAKFTVQEINVERIHNVPRHDDITGREKLKSSITKALLNAKSPVLIKGGPGAGKTAICNLIGHEIFEKYEHKFDYIFYCTAKANPITLEEFCNKIAQFFGEQNILSLQEIDAKKDAVFHQLFLRKVVIIIDNFEAISDLDLIDFVFMLPAEVPILISSRSLIPERICDIQKVSPLNKESSLTLFEKELIRVGIPPDDLSHEGGSLSKMMELTDGNPLAIKWSVGRLSQGISMASVCERLASAKGSVFEAMFMDTWKNLSNGAKNGLLMCAVLGEDVDSRIISNALTKKKINGEDECATLVRVGLLDVVRNSRMSKLRYTLHPLARSFAKSKYEELSQKDSELLNPLGIAIKDHFKDRRLLQMGRQEYDSLEQEISNILHWYSAAKNISSSEKIFVEIAFLSNVLMWTKGYWEERKSVCLNAANLSKKMGDGINQGRLLSFVGIVFLWQGHIDKAEKYAEQTKSAFTIGSALDNSLSYRLEGLVFYKAGLISKSLRNMMGVLETMNDVKDSDVENIRYFSDWPCDGEKGWKSGEVAITQEIGIMYVDSKNFTDAEVWCLKSLRLAEEIGDIEGASIALSNYGRALQLTDRTDDAIETFLDGLNRAKQVGRKSTEGRCYLGLAQAYLQSKHNRLARDNALIAIDIFSKLGMKNETSQAQEIIEKTKGNSILWA